MWVVKQRAAMPLLPLLALMACSTPYGEDHGSEGADHAAGATSTDSNATGIAVAVASVDFEHVSCNTESAPQSIVVANTTSVARPFSVLMPEGTPFTSNDPLSGTLPADGHVTVKVFAKPTVAGTVKANITVTSGSSFVIVPVGVVGVGGALEWSTQLADIGDTPVTTDGTTKVFLKNTGTADATVTRFATLTPSGSPFSAGPDNLAIRAGGQSEVTLTLAKGLPSAKLSEGLRPVAEGLCAAAPIMTVTGQRVVNTLTVTGADWGKRDCNTTTSEERAVVVRNYASKPLRWTVKTAPTRYRLVGASTGIVDVGNGTTPGEANIAFTAPAFGSTLGPLTETVTVAIENYNGSNLEAPVIGERQVALRSDVRGAIVALSTTELTFVADIGSSTTQPLVIRNTGNEMASLTWAFARTAGQPAWTGLPSTTLTLNGLTSTIMLGYTPTGDPPNAATLTPSRNGGAKICNPGELAVVTVKGLKP